MERYMYEETVEITAGLSLFDYLNSRNALNAGYFDGLRYGDVRAEGASSQGQNPQQGKKNKINQKTDCDDFTFKSHATYNDVRNLYFANSVYRNMVGGAAVEFGAWAIFDSSNNYQELNQNWTWEIRHTKPRDERVPAGARAMIHTHPYNLMTSPKDNKSANMLEMPVYAISHLGISGL